MYEMYNISFYNLNISQQRVVLFMLAKSQIPEMIRLLGVMPLAVNTALLVSIVVYVQLNYSETIYVFHRLLKTFIASP